MSDCDMDATFYWIGMAAIATVAVLLSTILGITALFTKTRDWLLSIPLFNNIKESCVEICLEHIEICPMF